MSENMTFSQIKHAAQYGKGKVVAGLAILFTTGANAALTAPTIDTGDFTTIAGAVILAAGVFWGIRKAIGLLR